MTELGIFFLVPFFTEEQYKIFKSYPYLRFICHKTLEIIAFNLASHLWQIKNQLSSSIKLSRTDFLKYHSDDRIGTCFIIIHLFRRTDIKH